MLGRRKADLIGIAFESQQSQTLRSLCTMVSYWGACRTVVGIGYNCHAKSRERKRFRLPTTYSYTFLRSVVCLSVVCLSSVILVHPA